MEPSKLQATATIAPESRLILWASIVLLPFATLAGVFPSAILPSLGIIALLLLLVLADACLAWGRLAGIRIESPQTVRLSKDREDGIRLHILNEDRKVRRLRIGLALPGEIYSPNKEMTTLLPDEEAATLLWPCKALKRGRYVLERCYIEASSPLGFWARRATVPISAEIRVYPNLFAERKHLAALFLNRGIGIHTQRQIGKGRDFEQLREYVPGDAYEEIHWKATARRRHPITKVYQIERTQEVYLIIDASRLSARIQCPVSEKENPDTGTPASSLTPHASRLTPHVSRLTPHASRLKDQSSSITTILDRFVTASLIMGMASERQGDRLGIAAFSDRVRGFVRASRGRAHHNACRDMLCTLHPKHVAPDFAELFTFLGTQIRRRALLIFLTNLDDPVLAEGFLKNMDMVCRRHLVLVNMLKPKNAKLLFSSPDIDSVEDLYSNLGGHFLLAGLQETAKLLKRHNAGFALLEDERMSVQLVSQYLAVKKRQIL